jgi:hypothetical protein
MYNCNPSAPYGHAEAWVQWYTIKPKFLQDKTYIAFYKSVKNVPIFSQRHAMGAKVQKGILFRNLDYIANEGAELDQLINKARACSLHETSLKKSSGGRQYCRVETHLYTCEEGGLLS